MTIKCHIMHYIVIPARPHTLDLNCFVLAMSTVPTAGPVLYIYVKYRGQTFIDQKKYGHAGHGHWTLDSAGELWP